MSPRLARPLLSFAALATSLLASVAAHAQGVDEFGSYGIRRGEQSESPQDSAFEFRFGRYQPEVDDSVDGSPFGDMYENTTRFIIGIEADWQLLRIPHLGTLGPGFGFGMTRFNAKAPFADKPGLSETTSRTSIAPMYLVGVLRADVLMRDFHIPLVPYAKLGLGYALWWSSDGDKTPKVNGEVGRGASYGLTYALGGMFLLDVLDEDDAKSADGMTGINNSYVFGEWFRPQLDGFGANKVLNVGSSSWLLGIAVEM
jgi:hypothetical protein